jgi:putative ABC transport system permease protein
MAVAGIETAGKIASPAGPLKSVWMAPKLAFRNLFHDTISLVVTLTGIVFSVVLLAVQCGLYLGSERTIAAVLDQVKADLWVMPIGVKSFDDPAVLAGRERYAVLSAPGVEMAHDLVVGFASWRKPRGGATTVLVVGSDWNQGGFRPWNIIKGSLDELAAPATVIVDDAYFSDLGLDGTDGMGEAAEINGNRVTVGAVTQGIRSFTTLPYIFTTLSRAQAFLDAAPEQASYTLVKVAPGQSIEEVRKAIAARLPDTEVLGHDEFRKRSLDYWMFQTPAGGGLIAGALLALIVGIVIVAQTLYASTKDHLNEFATLRALGASASYIHQVILMQAMISALVGYLIGMLISLIVVWATDGSSLTIAMTPLLVAALFLVTIGMCGIAAMSAILKVTRIDPAGVFSR